MMDSIKIRHDSPGSYHATAPTGTVLTAPCGSVWGLFAMLTPPPRMPKSFFRGFL